MSGSVSGQLPIFEKVIDIGHWGRTVHKESVQDYAQVMDLHLPKRQCVLRLCDRLYQYTQGVTLARADEINSRIKWNNLLQQILKTIDAPHQKEFTRFSKDALEFIKIMPAIKSHLDIDRRAPSDWDLAFHLYSSLHYFYQQL